MAFRDRPEVQLAVGLGHADRGLASGWWVVLFLRGLLPAGFSITTGVLVAAIQRHQSLVGGLTAVGVLFVAIQVLSPLHTALSANLGDRTAAWLYDRLSDACVAEEGIGHLEDPGLAADLQVARDFDRGMMGPPLSISMDFIASGLVDMVAGLAQAAVLFALAWWAAPVMAAGWLATHWLLRESGVWKDRNTDEVRMAQRDADYTYRLAVDPPAAKEIRVFGLSEWVLDRFIARRRRLHELQYQATRMRERSVVASLAVVAVTNGAVLWYLAHQALDARIGLGPLVVYASAAIGASSIAFGGLNWALDGAAAPVAAVTRLEQAIGASRLVVSGAGSASGSGSVSLSGRPLRSIRFRDVSFAYPSAPDRLILDGFDLEVPAGSSLAIVGVNGAGKTTLIKLLCRLYDPTGGAIEIDGTDLRELDLAGWRRRVTAVFQDFVRFELSLRDNVAPSGISSGAASGASGAAPGASGAASGGSGVASGGSAFDDEVVSAALEEARAAHLAGLDTVLAKGYTGGTELSGGQWQRVALARALAAVRSGAGLVVLDEPTAQLDVRGEAEIFERVLTATRHCTTILVSHRFSTVRLVDRIAVVENGRVVELGSHDELMAAGGRYRTMFTLQAQRFASGAPEEGEEETVFDVLA